MNVRCPKCGKLFEGYDRRNVLPAHGIINGQFPECKRKINLTPAPRGREKGWFKWKMR